MVISPTLLKTWKIKVVFLNSVEIKYIKSVFDDQFWNSNKRFYYFEDKFTILHQYKYLCKTINSYGNC